jgi:hypothetical protein
MDARLTVIAASLAACAAASLPSQALGQDGAPPSDSAQAKAEAVLAEAQELLGSSGPSATSVSEDEPTLVLAELAQAMPALDPDDRRAAEAIFARPDDGAADRYGDGYTVPEDPQSPDCTANFCVHWVDSGIDRPPLDDDNATSPGDGVPDQVEDVQESAEDSYTAENTTLGWVEPKSDGTRGGGGTGLTDIYLLETNGRYYGYSSPDEGQSATTSKFGYVVLDDDYDEFVTSQTNELEAMQVTMAHEYNHVLQFTYDSSEQLWMLESTATWMEEQVYPAIDDYLGYIRSYARTPAVPLTSSGGARIYGEAVWNHYLTATDGVTAIRTAWEDSDTVTPAHLAAAAYDSAVGGSGNPFDVLGDRFIGFAGAAAEWRAMPLTFPDAENYPNVDRRGRMDADGSAERVRLDHLGFVLFKVPVSVAAGDAVVLKGRGPTGTHYGIALVARTGTATGGIVTNITDSADAGGADSVTLPQGSYDRVTAVLANADARVNGARQYRRDDQNFRLKLASP